MKRSEFLAIIPCLSAIPFIGTDIIKNEKGIFIQNPEVSKDSKFTFSNYNPTEIELRIYYKNEYIGNAMTTRIDWENSFSGQKRCTIEGQVIGGLLIS